MMQIRWPEPDYIDQIFGNFELPLEIQEFEKLLLKRIEGHIEDIIKIKVSIEFYCPECDRHFEYNEHGPFRVQVIDSSRWPIEVVCNECIDWWRVIDACWMIK